jgi:hypothetical protein
VGVSRATSVLKPSGTPFLGKESQRLNAGLSAKNILRFMMREPLNQNHRGKGASMTRNEIEHMWKVASDNPNHDTNWHDPVVEAFAKLVAKHTLLNIDPSHRSQTQGEEHMNYMQHEIDTLKNLKLKEPHVNREMSVALIRAAGLLPAEEDNLDWSSFNFTQLEQLILLVQMTESATIMSLMQSVTDIAEMEIAKEQSELIQKQGFRLS